MNIGIIPARYDSSRFPGKLLADLDGITVLERTWRDVCKAESLDKVVIASGDERISNAARDFNADVIDVFSACKTGSDRIAKALDQLDAVDDYDIIVNVQGDEPFIEANTIDSTVRLLISHPEAGVATAITPFANKSQFANPSAVKAVIDNNNFVMYFSRESIPYGWEGSAGVAYQHLGLYAYRRNVLIDFTKSEVCEIERLEKLEQLRLLYHGVKIVANIVDTPGFGIDTEDDLSRAHKILAVTPRNN